VNFDLSMGYHQDEVMVAWKRVPSKYHGDESRASSSHDCTMEPSMSEREVDVSIYKGPLTC
jgi:hypothetical protein